MGLCLPKPTLASVCAGLPRVDADTGHKQQAAQVERAVHGPWLMLALLWAWAKADLRRASGWMAATVGQRRLGRLQLQFAAAWLGVLLVIGIVAFAW